MLFRSQRGVGARVSVVARRAAHPLRLQRADAVLHPLQQGAAGGQQALGALVVLVAQIAAGVQAVQQEREVLADAPELPDELRDAYRQLARLLGGMSL